MSEREKKEAFVTLATNDTYSLGCLVLGSSLRRVGTTRQLVVMVTAGVTNPMRTQLAQVFDVIQEVNVLDSQDPINLALLGRPDLNVTFTKLHCWRLTQYEKAVFLDADTLVLQNVDELFDREELSASPDAGWPDCFNSGVFVFKPSQETYDSLLTFATSSGSFDGGDQGLLNMYFQDWATKDINKHLPFIYNVVSQAFYSYLPAFTQFKDRVKIVHFIGAVKPWHHTYNTSTNTVTPLPGTGHSQEFLQVWWNLFMERIQPNLDPSLQEELTRTAIMAANTDQENTNTNSQTRADSQEGLSVMKIVFPYKNPEVDKVYYDPSEETESNIVDMHVIPRSYTELESHYAEEPLSHVNPEGPGTSMYDATWITKGWEKNKNLSDKSSELLEYCSSESVESEISIKEKDSTKPSTSSRRTKRPANLNTEVGLVSQLGSLSIQGGVASGGSQVRLSDQERKLNWEKGCIDYLGEDSFDNIQKKIESSMSPQSPKEPPTEQPVASATKPSVTTATKPVTTATKPVTTATKPVTTATKPSVTTATKPSVTKATIPTITTTSAATSKPDPSKPAPSKPATKTSAMKITVASKKK